MFRTERQGSKMRLRFFFAVLVIVVGASPLWARPARALQPLEDFLAGAERTNREQLIALAEARQEGGIALAKLDQVLPSLAVRGSYTRNPYPVAIDGGMLVKSNAPVGGGGLVLIPGNQLDAQLRVEAPVLNLSGWINAKAARVAAEGHNDAALAITLDVQRQVAEEYFRLVGLHALLKGAKKRVQASGAVAELVEQRYEQGAIPLVDVKRARTVAASALLGHSDASMAVALSTQALVTLTGLEPHGEAPDLDDDLRAEGSIERWIDGQPERLPSVAAALSSQRSADLVAWAGDLVWVPVVSVSAQETFTNATGF